MNFIVNVGASLVGALLFWLATKYLRPALHQLLWRGTQIAGDWDFFDADPTTGTKPVGVVHLKQHAAAVTAEAVRHIHRDGSPTHRKFVYSGRFAGRDLVLTFFAPDRPDYIRGALVLHLDDSASTFAGKTMYYNEEEGTVTPYPIWYRRRSAG